MADQGSSSETLARELGDFIIDYQYSVRNKRPELRLRSKSSGQHYAVHTRYTLLGDDGSVLNTPEITPEVAAFIIDHFEIRGDTASFDIYESDLRAGRLLPRHLPKVTPEDVRHTLTTEEQSFTATGAKLAQHWPIFKKYAETGFGSIIRATMTLHQVCASHCQYCSTIARNKADSISLEEAKSFVTKLYFDQAQVNREKFSDYNRLYRERTGVDIRLRSLILSGGGQPNLWPHFESFVEWLSGLDIDLGLITNGFPQKVSEEIYSKFKWIRISITPPEASPFYPNGRFDEQYLPSSIVKNEKVTVGYSYVYGPWTTDETLDRISQSMDQRGFRYCRLLTDCNLTRTGQLRAHQTLAERLYRLNFIEADGTPTGRFFHQLKYHGTSPEAQELWNEGQCFLQVYNVFWDTTGHEAQGSSYCYACDSITVLAEELSSSYVKASERKFNHERWGTVKNTEVEKLFVEPVKPFFDPRSVCSSCLFMRNNQTVKDLSRFDDAAYNAIPDLKLEHVNFP